MVKRLASLLVAGGALVALMILPSSGADAHHATSSRLFIKPVATRLGWYDVSNGEDPYYRKVTIVSYKVVGCEPGEPLYWSTGPVYQDGRQIYGVFGGLGQGEDTCKADGTSAYADLWYGDPKNLHPGRIKVNATIYRQVEEDHVIYNVLLAKASRTVWIPKCAHIR